MNQKIILSKSKIMTGLKCSKRLYLDVYKRVLRQPDSIFEAKLFELGIFIGKLAQLLYPEGFLIQSDYKDHEAIPSSDQ